MTSGNWTVGTPSDPIYSHKEWVGGDGKYEAWIGGTRNKWNNYEMYHQKSSRGPYTVYWNPEVNQIPGRPLDGSGGIRDITGWTTNDDLRLLNKLAENIKGHSFDLGINIAEARKSYATILTNLSSVGSALRDLKHGNLTRALRTLSAGRAGPRNGGIRRLKTKDLSGRWLETQYAFLPLISQSFEAGKALEAATRMRVFRFTASLSTRRNDDVYINGAYQQIIHWTYNRKLLAELSEDVPLERSLGLTNPASIAWEVVPYSFVIDWFLPVGAYLAAWGFIPALKGRFLVVERGGAKHGPGDVSKGSNPHVEYWKDYKATGRRMSLFRTRRTVSSSLSVPMPTFNSVPRALSPRRLLSSVALIHQRLR
jgi:hypothetical protein